jgi:hypothetical protein
MLVEITNSYVFVKLRCHIPNSRCFFTASKKKEEKEEKK